MSNVLKPLYKNISGFGGSQTANENDIVLDGEKPIALGRKEITGDYTVEENIGLVAVGNISSPITITLPSDQNYLGRVIKIQDEGGNSGSNTITVETEGSEQINGTSSISISNNHNREVIYSNGSDYFGLISSVMRYVDTSVNENGGITESKENELYSFFELHEQITEAPNVPVASASEITTPKTGRKIFFDSGNANTFSYKDTNGNVSVI